MNAMIEESRHLAHVSAHCLFLAADDAEMATDGLAIGRLLSISRTGGMWLSAACVYGPIWVTVRQLPMVPWEPLPEAMKGWEIGEEATVLVIESLSLYDPIGGFHAPDVFVPEHPGLHRVRVLARGRAAPDELVQDDPREEYDISLWPLEVDPQWASAGDEGE